MGFSQQNIGSGITTPQNSVEMATTFPYVSSKVHLKNNHLFDHLLFSTSKWTCTLTLKVQNSPFFLCHLMKNFSLKVKKKGSFLCKERVKLKQIKNMHYTSAFYAAAERHLQNFCKCFLFQ